MLATMAEEAFTGAPASSFALIAASSKAPRSFAACCARTASIAFAVCDLSFATFVRLPLPLCHRLQVLSAVRQRVVAGVVSHDHDRDGLAPLVCGSVAHRFFLPPTLLLPLPLAAPISIAAPHLTRPMERILLNKL